MPPVVDEEQGQGRIHEHEKQARHEATKPDEMRASCIECVRCLTLSQRLYLLFALPVLIFLVNRWSKDSSRGYSNYGATGHLLSFALLFLLFPRSEESTSKASGDAGGAAAANPGGQEVKRSRARLYFLDNLRMFVTQLVVTFHITISWFGGGSVDGFQVGNYLNPFFPVVQSFFLAPCYAFFMCLLFFISGLVTPGSFKRKGVREFIYERCMRLGLPFVATFWLLMPFLYWWVSSWTGHGWEYHPSRGVMWFVQMLLVFNFVYALSPSSKISMPLPPTWALLLAGAALGLLSAYLGRIGFNAFGAPGGDPGGLAFDTVFFFAGCIAKDNGWLESIIAIKGWELMLIRGISIFFLLVYPFGINSLLATWGTTPTTIEGWAPAHEPTFAALLVELSNSPFSLFNNNNWIILAAAGVYSVSMSLSLIHLFAHRFNFSGPKLANLNQAQYGVYIFHPFIWTVFAWLFLSIYEASGGEKLVFYDETDVPCQQRKVSSTPLSHGVRVTGWIVTLVLSTSTLWPLAYFMRKIPGLDKVL